MSRVGPSHQKKKKRKRRKLGKPAYPASSIKYRQKTNNPLITAFGLAQSEESESLVVFSSLRRAADSDGECNGCGHYPNKAVSINTDEGKKTVNVCKKCGNIMRPYHY